MIAAAPSTSTPGPAEQMRAMLAGHIVTQCLHATASLGIADLIAEGRSAIGDLARATGTHPPSLHRMLRTLASLGVLTETADGKFSLTPVGATLRSDTPDSLRQVSKATGNRLRQQHSNHRLSSSTPNSVHSQLES
jgi:DNA-binding IclR family transcriptional regulator